MKNKQKIFLEGQKINLRTIESGDLTTEYRDWFNDAEVCQFNSHHRFPNYDEDMKNYYERVIKSRNNLILAIIDKETDKHIGNVSLQDIDFLNQSAEFAIIIGDKSFWSRGVGREAATLIMAHGFRELNLHRIYCGTYASNAGMQKLAVKLGFKEEGRGREEVFKGGTFVDVIKYGILRNEFQS